MEMKKWLLWLGVALAAVVACMLSLMAGAVAGGVAGYYAARGVPRAIVPAPTPESGAPLGPMQEAPQPWQSVPEPWGLSPEEMVPSLGWQLTGALISEVEPGEPADEAGVEEGDIVLAVDQKALQESRDLATVIHEHRPGDKVVLTLLRRGEETEILEVDVTLGRDTDEEGEVVARLGVRYGTVTTGFCLTSPDNRSPWD
jgi:membrane-associated protease RseP (regulator of RpoE activity)